MLILTSILRKWLLRFFSKLFEAQGQRSRAKHEENELDVHIVENLIILELHYCLHDLMFQTTFLQSSQGLKLKMRSPFIFKTSRPFRKTETSLLKVQTLARCLIFWL